MNDFSSVVHTRFMEVRQSGGVKTLMAVSFAWLLGASVAGAAETLAIEREHSQVEVAVNATVDSFVAKLPSYDADVVVEPATGRVTQATFRFKFADLLTGKSGRDKQMHEWQRTEQFPDGEFTLAKLTTAEDGRMVAHGTLLFHGLRKELEFPVSVTRDQARYAIDGAAELDTRDFGLPVIRKFALLKVDPVVTVRFHLQGHVPAKS